LISLSEGAIAASQKPGAQSEAITEQLAPGIYIIQVSSYRDANTNYQLSFSNSGAGVDPGNSRNTALDMGEVSRTNRCRLSAPMISSIWTWVLPQRACIPLAQNAPEQFAKAVAPSMKTII
jgi:hypothetical protein